MNYNFEVAISFAGEDRDFAEAVATGLREKGIKIYYDDFYKEESWGIDLSVELRDTYFDDSRFCIMLISEHYLKKMWPIFERQQIIERQIKEKGNVYLLPVRLNNFQGEVPGLSNSVAYLIANRNEPNKIVQAFLRKISNQNTQSSASRDSISQPHIPILNKQFSDKEKHDFLKRSFEIIDDYISQALFQTTAKNSYFGYEKEPFHSRMNFFTVYHNEKQICQFKIWLSSTHGGAQTIKFIHGTSVDDSIDNSYNEEIYIAEDVNVLRLKPLGISLFARPIQELLTPDEVGEYLWNIICQYYLK